MHVWLKLFPIFYSAVSLHLTLKISIIICGETKLVFVLSLRLKFVKFEFCFPLNEWRPYFLLIWCQYIIRVTDCHKDSRIQQSGLNICLLRRFWPRKTFESLVSFFFFRKMNILIGCLVIISFALWSVQCNETFKVPGTCTERFSAYPNDCNKYYICIHGKSLGRSCQPDRHWNDQLKICDLPDRDKCVKVPTVHPEQNLACC